MCRRKLWKEAWELYRISNGLHEKDDAIQIATIQSVLGTKARRVLKTLPDISRKGLLQALETYYVPRKNTTYERYVFRMTIQEVPLRLMDKLKGTLNGREYRRNRRHMHLTQEPPVTILNDHLIDESQAISITPHT